MTRSNIVSNAVLPPIIVAADEAQRLCALANSNMVLFPRAAVFLARDEPCKRSREKCR